MSHILDFGDAVISHYRCTSPTRVRASAAGHTASPAGDTVSLAGDTASPVGDTASPKSWICDTAVIKIKYFTLSSSRQRPEKSINDVAVVDVLAVSLKCVNFV